MTAWLDGLTLDTSAWGPAAEVEGLRWWRAETAMMNLRFFDMAPDIERLDVEYLRATMLEEMSLAEEHGWPLETIERLVTEGTMPPPPTQNGLIEVEIFRVQGVPLGAITTRQQVEGEIRFGTTLMVMFSTCFGRRGSRSKSPSRSESESASTRRSALHVDEVSERSGGVLPAGPAPELRGALHSIGNRQ
jgi:hypothetical protein